MTNSKLVNRKVLIPTAIEAVAIALTIWGPSTTIATVNSSTSGYHQMPNITGSVDAAKNMDAFIKNNQKVSFQQGSEIAAEKNANGTVIGGHLGVVQGYLVYIFYVGNIQNKISYLTIVDPRNGHVLYNNVLAYLTIADAGAPSHVISIKQRTPLT